MKKAILLLLLLWALTVPAWGTELPREVRDALPAAAEDITEHMDDSASFSEGLSLLWERACGYLTDALRESISGGVLLLAAAVLWNAWTPPEERSTLCPWPGLWPSLWRQRAA